MKHALTRWSIRRPACKAATHEPRDGATRWMALWIACTRTLRRAADRIKWPLVGGARGYRAIHVDVAHRHMCFTLEAGGLLCLLDAAGQVLHCDSGRLWITQEACFDDITLVDGQSAPIERDGKTLVLGVAESRLSVSTAESPADRVTGAAVEFSVRLEAGSGNESAALRDAA